MYVCMDICHWINNVRWQCYKRLGCLAETISVTILVTAFFTLLAACRIPSSLVDMSTNQNKTKHVVNLCIWYNPPYTKEDLTICYPIRKQGQHFVIKLFELFLFISSHVTPILHQCCMCATIHQLCSTYSGCYQTWLRNNDIIQQVYRLQPNF